MTLKEIAAISGKSGLFKIIKPTKNGVILESIDEAKSKSIANNSTRVSILNEISMYTTGAESSKPLIEIFNSIYSKFGTDIAVNPKSDAAELSNFLSSVLPDYDKDRIYTSDIKKLVTWYSILAKNYPEVLVAKEQTEANSKVEQKADETNASIEQEIEEKPKSKKVSKSKA
jgi:hypothetical protein